MGSGKSTLGRALATAKNISFVDLDLYIAEREKCSVPDIFKNKGEIYFRKKEALYLQEVLQKEEDMVLSLGGAHLALAIICPLSKPLGQRVFI